MTRPFPLNSEQLRAKRAIQQLACRCIRLAAIDMIGVVSGDRPLEQVADCCPFVWGGTVYQISPDGDKLNVLGMYGGSLTLSQSNWQPRRGELYAARPVAKRTITWVGSPFFAGRTIQHR